MKQAKKLESVNSKLFNKKFDSSTIYGGGEASTSTNGLRFSQGKTSTVKPPIDNYGDLDFSA